MRSVPASVIVVAHDSASTLAACLATLESQVDDLQAEVVVVDNASTDDSAAIASAAGATVVRSDDNLGFAGGCNLGAEASRGDVIVLVNPDSELDPGALAALVRGASGPVGPVGGRAHHPDGSFDPRCTLGRPRLRGALAFAIGLDTLARGSSWFDPEFGLDDIAAGAGAVVEVDAVSGAVMAIRRDLWTRLGGLDERYFVYGEDVDVCLRSEALGRVPVIVTDAGYQHVGGMTADGTAWRRTLLFRGKAQLYRDHLPAPAAGLAVACLQAGALLRGLPAVLDVGLGAARAAPWLRLFRDRRSWRRGHTGYAGVVSGRRPSDACPPPHGRDRA